LVPGKHASTFGGNNLACAAGVAVIEAIEEDHLLENANTLGQYLREKLLELQQRFSIIESVRGKGLMVGVQLSGPGAGIVDRCLEKRLRINCTQETVLRFLPPMIATTEHIDKAIQIFQDVLSERG
jgi:acetylornithine/succinyldiaminopimelate/putrescine aminotransferase